MAEGLTSEGIERLHLTAARHVGDTLVPGLVALVASGDQVHVEALGGLAVGGDPTLDLVVVVLTQRMFETSQAPQVHRDIQAAAYAALA